MKISTRIRFLFSFFILLLLVNACSKKHFICPAYNSYFIHDQVERESRFSPFIVDSLNNSNIEQGTFVMSDPTLDSTSVNNESSAVSLVSNSKFQPKEQLPPRKSLPTGLHISSNSKIKTVRSNADIEMKIIIVKPLSRYSNLDSSSLNKNVEVPSDSLPSN